jgi:hypothetical protein
MKESVLNVRTIVDLALQQHLSLYIKGLVHHHSAWIKAIHGTADLENNTSKE